MHQKDLFDKNWGSSKGSKLRDEALVKVEENAETDWKLEAFRCLKKVARSQARLTVDDVTPLIQSSTHEKRAMGAVMQAGKKSLLIEPTNEFVPSRNPKCHATPRRIWKSRIYNP